MVDGAGAWVVGAMRGFPFRFAAPGCRVGETGQVVLELRHRVRQFIPRHSPRSRVAGTTSQSDGQRPPV